MSEAITFDTLQRQFEQLFLTQRLCPQSVTISEADYEAFSYSVVPHREWTDIERELLGEACIAKENAYEERRKHIDAIVNYMDGSMVKLIRDASLPAGTLSFGFTGPRFKETPHVFIVEEVRKALAEVWED